MNSQTLISQLSGYVAMSRPTLIYLSMIFLIINYVWTYASQMIVEQGTRVNYRSVVGSAIMVLVVISYNELFYLAELVLDELGELVLPVSTEQVMANLEHMSKALKESIDQEHLRQLGGDAPIMHPIISMNAAGDAFGSTFAWLFAVVSQGIAMLIRAFISKFEVIFVAILYFVGPIAFTFSALPGFSGAFKGWLKWLITAKMIVLTVRVLDIVTIYVDENIVTPKLETGTTADRVTFGQDIIVLHLVLMSFYFFAPLVTTIYCAGTSAIGAFINKSVAGASTLGSFVYGRMGALMPRGSASSPMPAPAPALSPMVNVHYNSNSSLHNPSGSSSSQVESKA